MLDLLKLPLIQALTPAQLAALAALELAPHFRVRDGWRRQGSANRINLATGMALCGAGLAETAIVKRHSALRITAEGKAFRQSQTERKRA